MVEIVKILNGEPVMLVDEKKLQVPRFVSDSNAASKERALLCQKARNYKAELAKAQEYDRRQDMIAEALGDTATGILVIAVIMIALYFGSI